MPTISLFYGIRVYINLRDKEHNPPHIHAEIDGYSAAFLISTGKLYRGTFPPRGSKMVEEFIELNRKELEEMWETEDYYQLPPIK